MVCVVSLSLVDMYHVSISTSISTRMFTRAISISIRWHMQAKKHKKFGAIAWPGCLLALDLIPIWGKMATHVLSN